MSEYTEPDMCLRCESPTSLCQCPHSVLDWYEYTEILLTESKVMRAALEDIHQYEGTSYAHARTVAHQGLSGEYSTQVMQSKCQKCGDTYSGAFCPCSYEVQDDDPAQVGQK